jgi:hypothetical protein
MDKSGQQQGEQITGDPSVSASVTSSVFTAEPPGLRIQPTPWVFARRRLVVSAISIVATELGEEESARRLTEVGTPVLKLSPSLHRRPPVALTSAVVVHRPPIPGRARHRPGPYPECEVDLQSSAAPKSNDTTEGYSPACAERVALR